MKRTGKVFVSMASLGILLNNVAYATTEIKIKQNGVSTKFVFIGVAAFVIILLLYLGYKMDTKGNDRSPKVSHKSEKIKKKLAQKAEEIKQNDGSYEEDKEVIYEEDKNEFKNEDLNDNIEYDENEDSLFSTTFNGEDKLDESDNSYGEVFDTSIIDGLDEEFESNTKKFEDTMLFNNENITKSSFGNDLEDEIDELENIDELEALKEEENKDTFIDELKNFKEPESDFKGFSSSSNEEISKKDFQVKDSSKSKNNLEENNDIANNEFLSQMEENLEKDKLNRKKDRTNKKSTDKNEEE